MTSVRAVDRAIDILQSFVGKAKPMKIVELEKATGIARPTLYRLMRTLEKRGLVRTADDPTRYELDYGVAELASAWLRKVEDEAARAEPALQKLSRTVGETVALAIKRNRKRVYVREIVSRHQLTIMRGVGAVEDLARGAGGLAILAFEPPEVQDKCIAAMAAKDQNAVRVELAAVKKRGFGLSRDAINPGVCAVAAPVFNASKAAVGSVAVYGPSSRISVDAARKIGQQLVASAREISALLI